MKKISFIVLMALMLFLGISAAAKTEDLSFDEYTGEALSDDYVEENEDGISTCGAIIVDPGAGGSSDDELEMNDTLATAKSINSYLSYDEHNKCKFVKYLSIANHSNGNADVDCFYFTNSYINKYFSVSIDVPDFFKYYISLYSVQETLQGTKYVYVGNSSEVLSYSNLEIGSYVIKFSSRNNTQAGYCITISLERENSIRNQENNSKANATTIYEGIEKTITPKSSYAYMKFYPSKTGQYNVYWNSFNIEDIEIYEYVNYSNNHEQGTYKKIYQLYDFKSKVNLYQHEKNAVKKIGYEGEHQYYICTKLKNNGNASLKIVYKDIIYYDNTRTLCDEKPKEILYPMDDLTVFTTTYDESNIDSKTSEIILFDKLTNDFSSSDGTYNKVYGGKNLETINCEDGIEDIEMHLDIYRFAAIRYTYEEDGDGESYVTQAMVDYLRFAVLEDTSGIYTNIRIIVLMNYTYTYLYDRNSLFLNDLTSATSLMHFSAGAYSASRDGVNSVSFSIGASANSKMIVSDLRKDVFEDLVAKAVGVASSVASTLYDVIEISGKIIYVTQQSKDVKEALKKELPSSAKSGEITASTAELRKNNIQYRKGIYYDASNELTSDIVTPYFPTRKELTSDYSEKIIFTIESKREGFLLEEMLSYFMTFDICFTSFSGNDYYYNLSLNRN